MLSSTNDDDFRRSEAAQSTNSFFSSTVLDSGACWNFARQGKVSTKGVPIRVPHQQALWPFDEHHKSHTVLWCHLFEFPFFFLPFNSIFGGLL